MGADNRGFGEGVVVTGQPGAGKSAVLGRAALQAEEAQHGAGLVFHARDATSMEFFDAVAATVGIGKVDGGSGLAEQLVGLESPGIVTVMVDALDEGASRVDRRNIAQFLAELAGLPWIRVVVATRPLAERDRYVYGSLLYALGVQGKDAKNLVDLDVEPYNDPKALHRYAVALLAQVGVDHPGPTGAAWEWYREHDKRCRALAGVIAERSDPNFLVAALTSERLSTSFQPLDATSDGFDPKILPSSAGEALDKYLDDLPADEQTRVKGMLTAVACARGAGISDQLWVAFTEALGYPVGQADLDQLRSSRATDYVLQTLPEATGRITRLFHQALIDQLLTNQDRTHHRAIFAALGRQVDVAGGWARVGVYLCTHAAGHAADADALNELLHDTNYLAHADLNRLVSVLNAQQVAKRSPTGTVVLMAANRAAGLSPNERLAVFALTAAHLGQQNTLDTFNTTLIPPRHVHWAHGLGHPHQRLTDHTHLNAVAVGRLGDRDVVVSASKDNSVRVWDEVGHLVGEPLAGHTDAVSSVAVGRLGDRDVIVSASLDSTVRVWDPNGKPIGEPFPLLARAGAVTIVGADLIVGTGKALARVTP